MTSTSFRPEPHLVVVERLGSVVAAAGPLPWILRDANGVEHPATSDYLRHMLACDYSPGNLRSYALALLRWLRFLRAVDVDWQRAQREDTRDFVLWMRTSAPARPAGQRVAGTVNPRTGKRCLGATFAPATINHNLAVISSYYSHQISQGSGPLLNPVPKRTAPRGGRAHAHHNPLEPFRQPRRGAYRQRVPQTSPRAIPDRMFDELFAAMRSNRDRALLALYVSCGARPAELLGLTGAMINYGEQLVGVIRKGSRALQWLPASPDAFVWLVLYLNELPTGLVTTDTTVWWTLRRPWRQLNYDALRAVLRRANEQLLTNWTLHDLRHTYAIRMADDPKVPLVSLQTLLGHAHLTSTQRYLLPRLEQVLAHARDHYRRQAIPEPAEHTPAENLGYDHGDLHELFGWQELRR
ncbi:tyrosine-type recombinase/integrase [Actinoplanes sp. G11-F43]|uniref:tyrosine-type recombinase/integrase n=1 Tax=Actinoplanes sp. G11-F43 TaxID=3424130 RepID=UPI003D32E7EB